MCNVIIDKTEIGDFQVCTDCGAHAPVGTIVEHYVSCVPGESKKWEEFYEKANELEKKVPFITIYLAVAGWKAQLMVWNDDDEELGGFWEPAQVSYWAYSTPEEAERYAKDWAKAEEVEYIKPTKKEEVDKDV